MQNREDLLSYAMDFASYLVKNVKGINQIILHGSVSRGDFNSDSDVDLFIDCDSKKEKQILRIKEKYLKTENYKKCKLKGIENEISLIVGNLASKEWSNLKRAIITTGILLYGKYKTNVEKINQYTIFVFENIKPDKKRVAVFRKLFGFKVGKKAYSGLIKKINGMKLGKNTIVVSSENTKQIKDFFKLKKITPKIYDVWSDVEIRG